MEPRNTYVRAAEDIVPGGLVLKLLGAMVLISVVLCLIAWLSLRAHERRLRPDGRFSESALGTPHEVAGVRPGLFEDTQPLPTLEEQQRADLRRYRWVDKKRGIARIPVEQAAHMYLDRGGK
jgi:hypothetical protein